ncbi:MAG: glutathione S-transferase family protein [Candidatus Eremiobacteraeota bacterium]|nr:glutathione S-transferase family protein [Candidatus Eremiobacteraeota bacterium]
MIEIKPQFPDEQSADGRFLRQKDHFRNWVSADRRSEYPAVANRYHLYVSLACPWAHRTVIVRKLLGLDDAIGMTVVDPIRNENGWAFRDGPGYSHDPINGFKYLKEAYIATDPKYRGRITVPVLWDKEEKRIVSNSDDDIMRMLETEFLGLAKNKVDLYPKTVARDIDELNDVIYETVNDGVYRAGFATSQRAYEQAAHLVFYTFDQLERRLGGSRYLFGKGIVETDIRLFTTLIRFDAVYYVHFKCNLRRIIDYPNLYGYLRDLYQFDGVAQTVDFDHIKRHYYCTHREINPAGIVPIGPEQDLLAPHARAAL